MNAVTPIRETRTTRFWRELTIAMELLGQPMPDLSDAEFHALKGMSVGEAALSLAGEFDRAARRRARDLESEGAGA